MIKYDDVYKIGRIGRPHGVKGEVTLRFADDVFDRTGSDYVILAVDGILVPFFMEEYRFSGSETALVKFCGVETKDRASALTGCDVYFPRNLADDTDGELSLAALVGFDIVDAGTGKAIGRVEAIDDSTANVLLVTEDGKMIPAADEIITDIDPKGKTITARLPEGLLDI